MSSSSWLQDLLKPFLVHSPLIAVYLVGIVLALKYWQRHSKVSLLTLVAFSILLVGLFMNLGLIMREPGAIKDYHSFYAVFGLIRMLSSTVAYGLLIAAIFGWRQDHTAEDVIQPPSRSPAS